jgi:maltooligosyltrehalose trehalohydrolase
MLRMTKPRVWAPRASRVALLVNGEELACTAQQEGWWEGPELGAGDDYLVTLDGGPGRPDPRSGWQPHGVHAPSRWIDPVTRNAPVPAGFLHVPLRDAVIYEMHVGTYTQAGTFEAASEHLDHLVDLGVTHVELMPIAQWSGDHGWGYDGVNLYAPHAPYGGPAGLRHFIGACHGRNLGVIIDVVHNHFGPDGAYHGEFGPYRTPLHQTPWGDAINLDGEHSTEVRRFLIESALQWLRDYGADGLRLDAVHALRDSSTRHFVAELVDEVRALEAKLDRPFLLIGEYDEHDPVVVTPRRQGGWGLDAHWNDDFHHALHSLLTGERSAYFADFSAPGTLARILEQGYALDGRVSGFRGGPHGIPFGSRPRHHLVGYAQSHDQIGNRAHGERLVHLVGADKAKIAAAIVLTSPFVPMLFQGEEWGASTPFLYFVDFEAPELRNAVREGRRREHAAAGWSEEAPDPTSPAARARSVLQWSELAGEQHAQMLQWYRDLIAARRRYPELRDSSVAATVADESSTTLHVHRGPFTLCANLSGHASIELQAGEVILASKPISESRTLAPLGCALVRA